MGLFKRGKVWWMRFNHEGQQFRKSTETGDLRLAERIYRKVMGEIVERRWFEKLPGEDKTFSEMMDKYLKEHVVNLRSERSFRGYAKNLKSHFGSFVVSRISPMMINEYRVKRLRQGLKPASVNRELATMKKAFNLALKEWQWVKENPVTRIALERENNKRDRWLIPGEEKRLLKASAAWLRNFIFFALNTGMRLGEILSLSWRGVDLDRKTVTVFEAKNDEKRTIPINGSTFKMLKKLGKVRSTKTGLVFYSSCHTKLDERNVRRDFQEAVKKAKIEDFRFHDLRHTFATRLIQNGVDVYKVQRLLGHKTPSMTQRYAHHYPESLRDGVEILDRVRKSTNLAHSAHRKADRKGHPIDIIGAHGRI